jgi:hypothetical protein
MRVGPRGTLRVIWALLGYYVALFRHGLWDLGGRYTPQPAKSTKRRTAHTEASYKPLLRWKGQSSTDSKWGLLAMWRYFNNDSTPRPGEIPGTHVREKRHMRHLYRRADWLAE